MSTFKQGDIGDEQETVAPETKTVPQPDAQPDASKLRKMSMSGENAAKLARESFKYVSL